MMDDVVGLSGHVEMSRASSTTRVFRSADARRAAVVTSLDMTAERRSSARRDRAHDASLGPPHMSGMVAKIGLPVMAQNSRDFDGRPAERSSGAGHDRRRRGLSRWHNLQRQAVEWARRRPDRVRSDLRIARSRRQTVMTEQNLNDLDVGSAFQEVRRETMAQGVQRDSLGQPGGFDRRSAGGVQHRRINGMIVIPTGKQRSSAAPASSRREECQATAATASHCGPCLLCHAEPGSRPARCRCPPLAAPRLSRP